MPGPTEIIVEYMGKTTGRCVGGAKVGLISLAIWVLNSALDGSVLAALFLELQAPSVSPVAVALATIRNCLLDNT